VEEGDQEWNLAKYGTRRISREIKCVWFSPEHVHELARTGTKMIVSIGHGEDKVCAYLTRDRYE
jgi:hypothetical protein